MTDSFYSVWRPEPQQADLVPQAIRAAPRPQVWRPAQVPSEGAVTRVFANAGQNSRLPQPLATGAWRMRWQTTLHRDLRAVAVLPASDRILVQGEGLWQLFDGEGKSIHTGRYWPATLTVDPERALFYSAGLAGEITALRLDDGEQAYYFTLTFGKAYARTLIARAGSRLLFLSVEQALDPGAKVKPDTSMVESLELPATPLLDDFSGAARVTPIGHLFRRSRLLRGALGGETLVLAARNALYFANLDLKIQRAFAAEFAPVALSVDEEARAYLLADTSSGRALWIVTPDGERTTATALPEEAAGADDPPVIGYDHRVYIRGSDRVYAYSPAGELLWRSARGPKAAGMAITANDRLLLAAGNLVFWLDSAGRAHGIRAVDNERLQTAPVLTGDGKLLVAGRSHLFCFEPE